MLDTDKLLNEIRNVKDDTVDGRNHLPDRKVIVYLLKETQVILMPDYFHFSELSQEEAMVELSASLCKLIRKVDPDCPDQEAWRRADAFLCSLPHVKELLLTDLQAIYDGDPAAKSKAEIILCYPGFYAVMIYRIAHVLYELQVPFIPRVMSEYAHEKTGIDINPGAKIGPYFCIDHGTGIVIGETATIGEHVKLYQGVTIGAKSFKMDEDGNPVKGGKRHPDIGSHVVIYANATILGGDTKVGDYCVIGGNVWLTHSVEPHQTITYKPCAADLLVHYKK